MQKSGSHNKRRYLKQLLAVWSLQIIFNQTNCNKIAESLAPRKKNVTGHKLMGRNAGQ